MFTKETLNTPESQDMVQAALARAGRGDTGIITFNWFEVIKNEVRNYITKDTTAYSSTYDIDRYMIKDDSFIIRYVKKSPASIDNYNESYVFGDKTYSKHEAMTQMLSQVDAKIKAVYYCPELFNIVIYSTSPLTKFPDCILFCLGLLLTQSNTDKTNTEYRLGVSLMSGDFEAFKEAIQALLKTELSMKGLRKSLLEANKNQWFTMSASHKIQTIKGRIERIKRDIKTALNSLQTWYDELKQEQKELLWAETQTFEVDDMALDYFNNEEVELEYEYSKSYNEPIYTVTAPLEYYDAEFAKAYYERLASSEPEYKKYKQAVLKEVFIDGKYKIWTKTQILFEIRQNRVRAEELSSRFSNLPFINQPHIMRYQCWGSAEAVIRECMNNGEYYAALMQTHTACKNMNLTDSIVFNTLIDMLRGTSKATIQNVETGKFISFEEFMEEVRQNG